MKKFYGLSSLAIALAFLVSCSGGGSSSGGSSSQPIQGTPELKSVTISPTSAQRNSAVQVNFAFSFTDTEGDLGGGTLNFSTGQSSKSMAIPSSYTGVKSGTGSGSLAAIADPNPGTYQYLVWLIDSKGTKSNTVTVTFTVT
jgi:hypothetical protein